MRKQTVKKRKKKFFKYTIIYIISMFFLFSFCLSVMVESEKIAEFDTKTINGKIQDINLYWVSGNSAEFVITINNNKYVLIWNSIEDFNEAYDKLEKYKNEVTILYVESVSAKGRDYNRIVDLSTEESTIYTLAQENSMNTFYFISAIVLLVVLGLIFTAFYIIFVITIKY